MISFTYSDLEFVLSYKIPHMPRMRIKKLDGAENIAPAVSHACKSHVDSLRERE